MVLGFYVSLDPPGAMGTGALHRVRGPTEGALAYRARGIDAVWPCWGVARHFTGAALEGELGRYKRKPGAIPGALVALDTTPG